MFIIKDNTIIEKRISKILPSINAKFVERNKQNIEGNLSSDPRIGVIDLETYKIVELQQSKVYAAGLRINGREPITYYIYKFTMDSNDVVYRLINELMNTTKYEGYKIYCDNLGSFDSLFIIRALLDYNNKTDS